MSDTTDLLPAQAPPAGETPALNVSPNESRFMFVDVAAARAKQLRRGAVVRVPASGHDAPKKLERLAMEEVRRGLIEYTIPELKRPGAPQTEL
jgi:DNA-directed RNA polymerase subunit K/omega